MSPWLDDGDVRLYHGDALEVLRELPDGSVDCVVTSPPYWGLRDYGTGQWERGNPEHEHETIAARNGRGGSGAPGKQTAGAFPSKFAKEYCECGARHLDQQLGLEATPDLFVTNMVAVFREIRRVLASHGTCWVNLGDSYAGGGYSNHDNTGGAQREDGGKQKHTGSATLGLKPKDLVGIPWRVALALQADGWYLRSDIIWAKPNPMPESVTDRPTKSHEYTFLLTKQPRYWFDAEAVREPSVYPDDDRKARSNRSQKRHPTDMVAGIREGSATYPSRNVRSVWQIATQPYPEAHFATFPEELARRCILAGCPVRVCRVCGRPSERIVEAERTNYRPITYAVAAANGAISGGTDRNFPDTVRRDLGWSDCGHNNWRTGVVLDPFMGSGTTAKVARDHLRHAIGIDLNEQYLELAGRRLQQLSLLGDHA